MREKYLSGDQEWDGHRGDIQRNEKGGGSTFIKPHGGSVTFGNSTPARPNIDSHHEGSYHKSDVDTTSVATANIHTNICN